MGISLFSARGSPNLLAVGPEAVFVAGLGDDELARASRDLLAGGEPMSVLGPGAERIPLAELARVTAPVLGRTLDLSWGRRTLRLRFPDRKSRDAALEAVGASLPGAGRTRERLPRAVAVLLPLAAGAYFAFDLPRAWAEGVGPALRVAVDALGLGLSAVWLGAWLWRPPDRIRLVGRPRPIS